MTNPQESLPLATEQKRLLSQIQATFDFMPDDPVGAEQLRPWIAWQCQEILQRISIEDFTDSELMSLVGTIGPIFARVLGGDLPLGLSEAPNGSPRLHSV